MLFVSLFGGLGEHPSASNARRYHGFPWERIAVLAEVEFCPLGASLFPSNQARYFGSLVVQGIASVLAYYLGRGHRGKAPVKLCIAAFNFQNCNAGIPSLLGKLLLLRSIVISKHFDTAFFKQISIDFMPNMLYTIFR